MEDGSLLSDLAYLSQPAADLPPTVATIVFVWTFCVGACIGSFLNVVIARLPEGISIVRPRSRCPKCGALITWRDNIPLFSWIVLRAKCRSCAAPISARYPFIELLIGLCAVAVVARWGFSLEGFESFTFIALLVCVSFIDLDTWTIPYALVAGLLILGLGVGALQAFVVGPVDLAGAEAAVLAGIPTLADRAIGALAALLAMGALVVVANGVARRLGRVPPDGSAMGWGDPLLLAGIGAVVGWRGLPFTVFLGSAQGALVGIVLLLSGRLKGGQPVSETDDWVPPRASVPFGPFLALGALEQHFFGGALRDLWLGLVSQ